MPYNARMKTLLPHLLFLPALLALGATNDPGIPVFKAYDIGFADASNTIEIVRTAIAPDGKVFFDPATRKLMVLAPDSRHSTVATLIQQLDVPPRNVSVTVRFLGKGDSRQSGASVSGTGGVVISGSGTRSTFSVQPRLVRQMAETSSQTSQQLLVASGRQASLFIGEEVPYIEWLMEYGRHHRYFEERIAWQRVGASLVMEPVVIGNGPMIRLRLTPELSGMVNNNPYRTRFANVATEVTVSDGVPFDLGGLTEKQDFYSRFLVGVDRSGARHTLHIELTARIIPVSGPTR